jgi:hypothetical protein
MVVELQRAEMGELLGDRGVEPGQETFSFGIDSTCGL